jgi:micrococcal nuclease
MTMKPFSWRKRSPAVPAWGILFALPFVLFLALYFLPLSASGQTGDTTVYVTSTGKKYHRDGCNSLRRSRIAIPLADAARSGYEPCSVCKPPVLTEPGGPAETAGEPAPLYRLNMGGPEGPAPDSVSAADLSRTLRVEVVDHIDGDTVRVRIPNPPAGLNAVETIRMIGVDTPETVHPRRETEYFGKEASEFTRQKLLGKGASLAFDWDLRDRYGRLLAYIFGPDGTSHNAALIREGYAHAYTRYSFHFMDEFRRLEQEARQAGRGLWGEREFHSQ